MHLAENSKYIVFFNPCFQLKKVKHVFYLSYNAYLFIYYGIKSKTSKSTRAFNNNF